MKPATSEAAAELEELAKGTRRGTATTLFAHLRRTRKSEVKPRKYYRRGTIFLEHLEAQKVAKGVDSKFVDTMKAHYEKSHMSTSTMIGLSIFQNGNNPVNDPFAVDNMPLEIQIGFRKKLFRLFSLQLLAVIGLDFAFTSAPGLGSWFRSPWNLFGVFCLMILSLFVLYLKKYIYPLNFGILAVYTVFQAIFLAGLDAYLAQHISLFVFIFTFVVITLHSVLCTVPLRGYMVSVAIAFGIVFMLSLIVFFTALHETLSPPMSVTEYLLASAFILILCLWFAYDASCMNQKLSPDEYMQGMIFFYTDMILFLIFLSMITFAFMACEGDACCCGSAEILPAYPVGVVGDAAGPVGEGGSERNNDEHAPTGVDNQTMVR
ncbi:hypothetical protein SPRG_14356 [Saprolegnia parasitica CBS 223.65]|uniref:Uncharacterized protein n=1 Tax=Saprolegnia parasitica (strain CBS 223.65) TaxID=695850 RepID=A0A067BQ79_SAPPC|nr:hypothetical protein SPRG_14356 [Saprolegnia parasitica CBS 223.65]KDO20418.1 hypothetical protein SPRG_14356 [Saprolegnia parasitica CBS 223.65]|eukprot:XP_012208874.1 hypothetical protein SPRG_14356 [Saprolegnia parasitica CBS 223.65]